MEYNGATPPMPHLRLPDDYIYNPLFFVPHSKSTPERGIGEDNVRASPHPRSHAVLPCTTYLHRPLRFAPPSSPATPVRSHRHRSGSRKTGPPHRSAHSFPAAASAPGQRDSSSVEVANASLLELSPMLAQGVMVQQRHLAVDHTAGHSVTAPSQDVTVDTTTVNFHTSIQRRTRATRLRIDYVHHCIEERDKAAQNIFFRPKGQSLPTSAPCSTPLTPTSQHGSSAASLQTPRSTKAAHLRQQAATQRIEEAEKWKLEKGAEEGLAQAAIESASRQSLVSLKAGAPMSSSSKVLSVERNGSALGEAAATSSNGAYSSHHTPRRRTSHTGSSSDTIVSARERVKTAKRSASTHSAPREEWRAAVLTYFDDRENALDQQQNVAEATYGPSEEVVLDARVSLPSAKDLPCKPSDEALTVLRGESISVKPNESIAVRLTPTACSDNKRMRPRHHCSGRSHTAQCDAGSPSPVALRDVRGTGTAPAVQITEAKMTPREDVRLAQRAASPKSSYQWEGDATWSSSMSSIVFTLSSAPQEDIAGEELPKVRQDRPQVPAQGSGALESCDGAGDSALLLRGPRRGSEEHSPSTLGFRAPTAAAPSSGERGAGLPPVALSALSCLPSPMHAGASVLSDEARMPAAAASDPNKGKTEICCAERETKRTLHPSGANKSPALRRPLEQAPQGTLEESSVHSNAGMLRRPAAFPLSVHAYPTQAHAPQTSSEESLDDVSLNLKLLSQDSHHTGSCVASTSGEVAAQPLIRRETTDQSTPIAAAPLQQQVWDDAAERGVEKALTVVEEEQPESSALSTQSSFVSIDSYHAEELVPTSAVARKPADEPLHAAALQAELLRHYRTAKSSSAVVESRLDSRAGQTTSLQSHAQVSSHREEAIRAVEDKLVLCGHDGVVPSSSLLLWNASADIDEELRRIAPAAVSSESEASWSVATDVSQMVARGGVGALPAWRLPVPPTNCTQVAATWETRQRAAVAADLANFSPTVEQPSRLLSDPVSESQTQQLSAAVVRSMPPYPPQMKGPVGREALDSLRLPNLQESGPCSPAPPSAAERANAAVAASVENVATGGVRREVVAEKAAALANGRATDDAANGAVSSDPVSALVSGQKANAGGLPVSRSAHRYDAHQRTVAAVSREKLSSLEDADQPAAITNAVAVSTPVNDLPRPHTTRLPPRRFAIGSKDRPAEKATEDLAVRVESVCPPNRAESTHRMEETGDFAAEGSSDRRAPVRTSLPTSPADTRAEAMVAKAVGGQNAVVLCDAGEDALLPRSESIESVISSVRRGEQKEVCAIPLNAAAAAAAARREDATAGRSRSSSAGVGGAEGAKHSGTVPFGTSASLLTQLCTPERSFAVTSALPTENGSFSLHGMEAGQSPLERSAYGRHAVSLSNGRGEEEVGEGVPHSHAPTPLLCRLQQRSRVTPPYDGVRQPTDIVAEEGKSDAPVTQPFSRSDASTRCLSAPATELQAAQNALEHARETAEETPAVPFDSSAISAPLAGEQCRGRQGDGHGE
ncbi:hypothetical protein, conserved [Leishmania lindenbergi]|uniref:Uncharacterized protein n=1 Tax=Leishmania lindenbergi TaxID=651832 RepID=A0AAW3A6B4_9TRYP